MKIDEIIEFVKTRHYKIGLRMIYKKYKVPPEEREPYRQLWKLIEKDLGE